MTADTLEALGAYSDARRAREVAETRHAVISAGYRDAADRVLEARLAEAAAVKALCALLGDD